MQLPLFFAEVPKPGRTPMSIQSLSSLFFVLCALALSSCSNRTRADQRLGIHRIHPAVVTQPTRHDTDDPAIWIHPTDPSQSLILGTDKDADGGLYVYRLDGTIVQQNVQYDLKRPNNVDVEYGLMLGGQKTDIAVVTERYTSKLRVYRLPDMAPVDGGGIDVFVGETGPEFRDLMGITLYKRPTDGAVFAIVGRKNGPTDGTYLWQYRLSDDGTGRVGATLERKFGQYSGKKEIEALACDDRLGYVYYSDEMHGIRKYYADPAMGNEQLALFGQTGFMRDQEGISIYEATDSTGYLLVSDQEADRFRIFTREGSPGNPHDHRQVAMVYVKTKHSDGSEVTHVPLNDTFSKGLFVAMSADKTYHFYRWEDIAGDSLQIRKAD
jgi:3-phytase